MMKRYLVMAAVAALILPAAVSAQTMTASGRIGAEVDMKIAKGLHIDAGYELRARDSFEGVERNQLNLGLSYKVNKYLKFGAGYIFIGHLNSSSELKPRHRAYFDATGSYKTGNWNFSLKERLQVTNKSYEINPYQETRNSLSLKSRLKATYTGFKKIRPYGYVELRNVFNDPSCTATYSTASDAYTNYSFTGYDDAYLNRLRTSLGAEWKCNKHNSIDFHILMDYNNSKTLDTNKEGTKLKSLTWDKGWCLTPAVTYKYSF